MQHRSATARYGDASLRALTRNLAFALPDEVGDFVGELGERGVASSGPFEVCAQRADNLIELLLKVAFPSGMPPPKLFVPVSQPGLKDGDDTAACHKRQGLEAERQRWGAGRGHYQSIAAPAGDEACSQAGVEAIRSRELAQRKV